MKGILPQKKTRMFFGDGDSEEVIESLRYQAGPGGRMLGKDSLVEAC